MFRWFLGSCGLVLFSTVGATKISTQEDTYSINEAINVVYSDTVSRSQDWIGIYPAGASNSWDNVVSWAWTDGNDNGSVFLQGIPTFGDYEVKFFHSNSFVDEASYAFSIINSDINISTQDKTYLVDEAIKVSYLNKQSGSQDWIGIYPAGASNSWDNVVSWAWTDGRENSVVSLKGISDEGQYEARLFLRNSFKAEAKVAFSVKEPATLGARIVSSTDIDKGTKFASPNGNGDDCSSELSPCGLKTALSQLEAGDVLFLRGGQYKVTDPLNITASGTKDQPIIIESYPSEVAVLDGQNRSTEDIQSGNYSTSNGLWVHAGNDYIHIRKLEVRGMANAGIKIHSSHNIVEGCIVHDNYYNGIHVIDGKTDHYLTPFIGGYNIIRDNLVYNNTDEGLFFAPYTNGGNSDGISISSSKNNQIIHNTVYSNSDDGIDSYRSNHSYIAYNIAYDNGKGAGNGEGIKSGSGHAETGNYAVVEHNLSYNNSRRGFNYNDGTGATFRYNTSYNNKYGFKVSDTTLTEYNISTNNLDGNQASASHLNNSWSSAYENDNIVFISTDPSSTDFLKLVPGSVFEGMGVHKGL